MADVKELQEVIAELILRIQTLEEQVKSLLPEEVHATERQQALVHWLLNKFNDVKGLTFTYKNGEKTLAQVEREVYLSNTRTSKEALNALKKFVDGYPTQSGGRLQAKWTPSGVLIEIPEVKEPVAF